MAAVVSQAHPAHPHGFLLRQQHQQSGPSSQSTAQHSLKAPADPYYGHEDLARLCARFIRHVFNCPPDAPTPVAFGGKPTESTVTLPKFIAYAFHRTRLPSCVAFHALFLLNRLKSRYPAASCAFGHRLFLTAYMLSSKVMCDDTYSNKSWAIVGQGFYELRDVNLMEREMIHYLCWDLNISGKDLEDFSEKIRSTYKKGVPKALFVVIPDTTREKDLFGKGHIVAAEKEQKIVPLPAAAAPIETQDIAPPPAPPADTPYPDPPPSYSSPPDHLSPYSDSDSTSSSDSSREASPIVQTPPDDGITSPSGLPGKPVPIDYVHHDSAISTKVPIHDSHPRERPNWGWAARTAW